ncbi:MAG: phage tail protein [Sphingomonas bacterium]|uniref:phage tail protein n=1 Tax=Sphingomonas bacterium TaxID=1895847 RepID=UPI0026260777|nr:phage tail protein [Sphingomonas bacterium]MDB5706045.1 phage tail protein [Sphingomonas bacterium]
MDVNGLPMWELAGRRAFGLAPDSAAPGIADRLHFKDMLGHVLLAENQDAPVLAETEAWARARLSDPSSIVDELGGFAWWDSATKTVHSSGFAPGSMTLDLPPGDPPVFIAPSDLALGDDDVLYVARDGALIWRDLRDRWLPAEIRRADFRADLIAPMPGGGAWVFDKLHGRLARGRGYPLQFGGLRDADPGRFDPVEPNRNPPRLVRMRVAKLDPVFEVVAMAGSAEGRLALLVWETGEAASILTLEDGAFVRRFRLQGLRFPYSLSWIGEDEVAVLAGDGGKPAVQAFVYPIEGAPIPDAVLAPGGRVHPLIKPTNAKFANRLAPVPHYLAEEAGGAPTIERPLRALSGARYARTGSVLIGPIDSGLAGCVWHRLYADAAIPKGSSIGIDALATEGRAPPALPGAPKAPAWAPHRIAAARAEDGVPTGSWVPQASEIAFADSTLACTPRVDAAGLWTLLLQHAGRRVRRITGRYLWLHVTLNGDSQGTPELAALRVYANRLSYRDRYLPAFYREPLSGPDAEADGPATQHDFLERMLHLYEGVLTETEGRIAGAWQLTDPAAAPDAALPWIGEWIGVQADPADSAARLRQSLLAAPYTAALNGTLGGLLAALELGTGGWLYEGARIDPYERAPAPGALAIATVGDTAARALALAMQPGGSCTMLAGGAITRGSIVVVEGFRLRRTFATILGADLADEEDPLTLGMQQSGNSFVCDTLILGDTARAELLSLYRGEIDAARSDTQAVQQFYARLAHRVLVLVRGVGDRNEMARLQDIVDAAIPAHVEATLHQAKRPLIVGAASLIGIDSWLDEPEKFEVVRIGRSIVGEGDFVAGSGGLDQRADGPVPIRPTAKASGPPVVRAGMPFVLSAIGSKGAPGHSISRHIWMWEQD